MITRASSYTPFRGPVKVTLHDCLACSGCLTSAETVMLEHQGIDELLDRLKDPAYTVVVSISPQSRSSLAAFYGLGPTETFRKLITLFRSIGVAAVFDTTCSRDLSLLETAAEFISRYRAMEGHQETRGQGEASTSAQGESRENFYMYIHTNLILFCFSLPPHLYKLFFYSQTH